MSYEKTNRRIISETGNYSENSGWDKMPGQKEDGYGVSQASTEGLQTLLSMK
jgi:hypothetical protein